MKKIASECTRFSFSDASEQSPLFASASDFCLADVKVSAQSLGCIR